jgi:SAM-dependent methyltransferase
MANSESESRAEILADYYKKYYHLTLYGNSCQSLGTRYFDFILERAWKNKTSRPRKLLEIGFASGEHVSKVQSFPSEKYVGLDINQPATDRFIQSLPDEQRQKISFVQSDAADMPFEDNYFDRVVSTCLLHHVQDPLKVLREVRRVTEGNGEIAIGVPCDPGILNRLVKSVITYPGMRRLGVERPKFIYALEHPNQVGGLVEIAKFVFQNDELGIKYAPFGFKSWNANLMLVLHVIVAK